MKHTRFGIAFLTLAMMVTLSVEIEASTRARRGIKVSRIESAIEAVAALTPVGAASGWGRVEVKDTWHDTALKRELEVDLFSLGPLSEYTVVVDGVIVGTVMTDAAGWASFELESPNDDSPPVPDGVPAAGLLEAAWVLDVSGAFVLEGSFMPLAAADDEVGSEHEEKIPLTDPRAGGTAAGVAKVERSDDGEQEFDTRATGLEPGVSYWIEVDGFAAGMVIADSVGQAELDLEWPDSSNPLPPELQPIEDLRLVEWLDDVDEVVLTGVFTGVSNDDDEGEDDGDDGEDDDDGDDDAEDAEDEVEGEITELFDDGFTLQTESTTVRVVVTDDTEFEGVAGLGGLVLGAFVKVEGTLTDIGFVASEVEVEHDDDDGDDGDDDDGDDGEDAEDEVEGEITELFDDGFTLQTESTTVRVVVTDDTEFEGVAGLVELAVGDVVEVEGSWTDLGFIAFKVEVEEDDPED